VQQGPTYSDGRQAAIHSYNLPIGVGDTVYVLGTDAMYVNGGHTNNSFRFTSSGQTTIATNSLRGNNFYSADVHYNGYIYNCYGSGQGGFSDLVVYNIAANSYSIQNGGGGQLATNGYVSAAVDTNRGRLLVVSPSGSSPMAGYIYFSLANPAAPSGRRTVSSVPSGYNNSLLFDPDTDQFVSLVSGSLQVRTLDAASLAAGGSPTWQTRTFTGTTPASGHGTGTFGRFQYIPELKGYLVCPTTASGVYFYRSV
jgi:hypothetical protein